MGASPHNPPANHRGFDFDFPELLRYEKRMAHRTFPALPRLFRRRHWLAVVGLLCGLSGLLASAALAATATATNTSAARLTFEQDIRPILKAHCFHCHGEGETLRGELDLRLRRFLLRGGESGPALVPGDAPGSRVYEMLRSGKMPKSDRKPTAQEIETVRRWIDSGAATAHEEPESLTAGMQITAEERQHWAFRPLYRPAVPKVAAAPSAHPIDAFLAARQAPLALHFAAEAPSLTLVRRAFFDLWGLPPTPSDLEAFLLDGTTNAYPNLVRRLLQSPRYGERWGRHWLDIAGYADSDGYSNDDTPRPYAYKYRDYVIRSFNRDLPFNRFVVEQLAGDELALTRHRDLEAAAQDPETREWLVATGYLRMAADGTASGGIDQDAARNQVLADTLKIVSTSLLGLSVGCAQCHDHRYDPLPQTDYYRLRAVFEPAYDWQHWRTPAERRISLYTAADRTKAAALEEEAGKLAKERETKQTEYLHAALRKHLEKFDAGVSNALWSAFQTTPDKRSPEQKKLLADNPSANINPGVLYQYNAQAAEDLKAMEAKIAEVRGRKPAEDFISLLTEPVGTVPVTHRFHRGDPKQPKEAILPGTPIVLAPGGASTDLPLPVECPPTSRRRLGFATWVTSPGNPLLARVLVNRVWMHHFGRGLVGTPADFGVQGERPTHPELLEWLAAVFTAPRSDDPQHPGLGWSLKGLHELIMTSHAYRQASTRDPQAAEVDPENRWYARRSVLRLDAEAIRDGFLAVSGALSERAFGPPVPVREDAVGQVVVGVDKKQGDNKMPVEVALGEEEFRRSVYVEVRRSRPLAFLNAFDAPVMEVNCEKRSSSTVAPQSLMLMNSEFTLQQARLFAARLRREAGPMREAQVERAWRLALGRAPSHEEFRSALEFLDRQITQITAPKSPTAPASNASPASPEPPEEQALSSLCQTLFSSNEFLYLD